MQDNSLFDRKQLRKSIREKRRNIPSEEQREVGRKITETALSQTVFSLGDHIALFMSADGEVETALLLNALLEQGKSCYLPVLEPATTTLQFRRYLPDRPLITNFFGLQEPDAEAPVIAPADLSTVFMPLVAFDLSGNRLGMGKGYYDRTFTFLKRNNATAPVLIGLAHECQRVGKLEAADWDVPLAGIITGQEFYRVR
jgi:5-formyltetrahydrofolate cyclo-ligase